MTDNYLNIILNGNNVKGIPGETILELSRRHGIELPTLCNDDRLEPFSSCFLCVVEVENLKGHQPACSTIITEGMKITTDSESIRKSRKMALELLLSNHYADCLGPCTQTCPAGVDVQGYISLIEKGLYNDAVALIKETNPLPAVCGRVCVRPCELECRRNLLDDDFPVGIDYLKRFVADRDLESPTKFVPSVKPSTGKKVAVIGAGPGGLSAAYFLQLEGHNADIYEAAPKSGGWLRYGIPEYRLPNDILDKEVKNITDLGVRIFYNRKLGDNLSYREIRQEYDATILTIGSQKGTGVGCEGEDAVNVFSGIDFLRNMEMTGQRHDFTGKTVAVIGGGNTAMDCCRTAARCKAAKVYIIYRRTEKEMPANPMEIHESKQEGVEYLFLTLPKKINKNEKGEVSGITCIRMMLGEPDASGRRSPVPIEGSDFDIPVDYILAAIGQKTDVNFIDDINTYAEEGKLQINRKGNIEADGQTLQTGIPSVFAAGDGVTGPATIVEAIAQARIAAFSANLFLAGLPVKPLNKPFISRKENFRKQTKEDYAGRFKSQPREEMPVIPADLRNNFREVELGYTDNEIANHETLRCLECGCSAFFHCDLQKYATEYGAFQRKFEGEFKEFRVDFRHPFIEIDNNKCILCGRCIRICREVVGADALGFVNRGFETVVVPSMGDSLQDTTCESCGLCISTCPTGALTENVAFKPGPVITDEANALCDYCSVGCSLTLLHKKGFVMGVKGAKGFVNRDGNICQYAKFGYRHFNDRSRILKPLLKKGNELFEISFEAAFDLIRDKIREVSPDENAFFAGARLSNEEMYLVQKLARAGVGTNNTGSFHYLGRNDGYPEFWRNNVPFEELGDVKKVYYIGIEINRDNPVAGYMVQLNRFRKNIPVVMVTTHRVNSMSHKTDETILINSYYYFIKAVIHYLVSNGLENKLYLHDLAQGWEKYREELLKENYDDLVKRSGVSNPSIIGKFAAEYNLQQNAVIFFSEKEISSATGKELFNLAMITGKHGKTGSGIICLKEKNNSQGLFDMGVLPEFGVGYQPISDPAFRNALKEIWNLKEIPEKTNDLLELLKQGSIRNLFIFGEDPAGCSVNEEVAGWLSKPQFLVVQDNFITPTAQMADLILPGSFPEESGGTFTNALRVIQVTNAHLPRRIEYSGTEQLAAILNKLGKGGPVHANEIFMEIISLLPKSREPEKHCNCAEGIVLRVTHRDDQYRIFSSGCDFIQKKFEEDFELALKVNR
ncbi:MAG: FAD-dependent oxidoreductase [Bacteroidota bacterium]|nr:FAD-dependent oxidoreductase [Bacteroidota bacterium]